MKKIGVVVCGNSGIDYLEHNFDIRLIRSSLHVNGHDYTDFVDIKADEFYQMIKENPSFHPTTAQTPTGVILETYESLKADGYDEAIVITISSQLSGTYEGALMAANMIEGFKVTVFDSKSVAYNEAVMALEAAKMAKEGKNTADIIDRLSYLRENQGLLVSVDTLKYLVKNGRLSGAAGFMGSMLKIKPMLSLSREGTIEPVEKIRTRQKAINRIIEKFVDEVYTEGMEVYVIHANADDVLEDVRARLSEKLPTVKDIKAYPLTPVVGAHAGHGALAIGWIKK